MPSPVRPVARLAAVLALLAVSGIAPVRAQFDQPRAKVSVSSGGLLVGKASRVIVLITVDPGFHIQADKPAPNYIATEVRVKAPKGYRVGKPAFPKPVIALAAGERIPVFEGKVPVVVPVVVPRGARGAQVFEVTVRYQACDAQSCFPPTDARVKAKLAIGKARKAEAQGQIAGTAAGAAPTAGSGTGEGTPSPVPGYTMRKIAQFVPPDQFVRFLSSGSIAADSGAGALDGLLRSGNLLVALPLVFLLGLALNLTPCVYPIIPITIGYFGSQANGSGRKPLTLALFYVLGMALMYSVLGVAAGLTGGLFGSQLQNPWVLASFAAIMFVLALSQFDRRDGRPIWELQLPSALRNRARSRSGVLGAMLMGLMVGVVAAPCVGPAVIALLQWVGSQRNPGLGFVVFFTLAVGLGLPYLFLATVSGSVRKLPRSGEWMVGVKHVFGVLMALMGFYYLQTLIDGVRPGLGAGVLAGAAALGGVYLLFLDRAGSRSRGFLAARRAIGLGALAAAVWLAWPAPAEVIRWQPYSDETLQRATADGKAVLVDFTAAWCAACKELEHQTFSHPRVGSAADGWVALRADMTDFAGPESLEWRRQYGIQGLPTVVRLVPQSEMAAR